MKTLIFSKNRIFLSMAILFSILSITSSCTKTTDNQGTPGTNEVWIQGMAFDPTTITVTSGTTITWTNKDGVAHTVTSNTGLFDSGTINANGTYSHMFATAGTYPYHCTIHPSMTATVIVN
jgi:plastocyanin